MNNTAGSTYSSGLDASTILAGTFTMDGKTKVMLWSDEIYSIHGYRPGDIVPTLDLTLAHKHPEDLPRIQALNADLFAHGGRVAIYHRLIDAHSHEHTVLTAGEAVLDQAGRLSIVSGLMLDLTSTIHGETELDAREAVQGALGTRETIANAAGILIGRLGIGSAEAFELLVSYSNNRNIKLASVANGLVSLAGNPADFSAMGAFVKNLQETHQRHRPPPR
jgi:hypothetical protein